VASIVAATLTAGGFTTVLSLSPATQAAPADSVCPFAGSGLVTSAADGPVAGPNPGSFVGPNAIALASDGSMFIADGNKGTSTIRQVSGGQITSLALVPGNPSVSSLAIDRSRTPNVLYGGGFGIVWRWVVGSPGPATIIAGRSGNDGPATFTGPATASTLGFFVEGLALTPTGNLLFGDGQNVASGVSPGGRVYQLASPANATLDATRSLTLVAGNGTFATTVDGPATASPLTFVSSMTVRNNGNIVYRTGLDLVEINPATGVQTVLNRSGLAVPETLGSAPLATANVITQGLLADRRAGSNIVYSYGAQVSRFQTLDLANGTVSDFVGSGESGYVDASGTSAQFAMEDYLSTATIGPDNSIYVADYWNRRIRRIDVTTQAVTTVAGSGQSAALPIGNARTQNLDRMTGTVYDPRNGDLYFATLYHRVLRYRADNGQIELYAGNGKGRFAGLMPAGARSGARTSVDIKRPSDMALDTGTGDLYVTTADNNGVWRLTPGGQAEVFDATNGVVGNIGSAAIAIDATGRRLYYTSSGQIRSLQITAAGLSGPDTVVAGGGATPIGITETPALSTNLADVSGVAVSSGSIFFSATSGVGRLDTATGTVSRIAGTYSGALGDGENATTVAAPDVAAVDTRTNPRQLTLATGVPGSASIYWADSFGVMAIIPDFSSGGGLTSQAYRSSIARRLTGKQWDLAAPQLGNGGPAAKATLFGVADISPAPDDEVYVTDSTVAPGILAQEIKLIATNGCARMRFTQQYSGGRSSALASGAGVPLADIPASALPLGLPGYGALTLASTSLVGTGIASSPISSIPISSIPISSIPISSIPISSIPISSIPLLNPAGGWVEVFKQTPFEGVPPQNVKFVDVLQSSNAKIRNAVQTITFADLDLTNSPLASISIVSIALGGSQIKDLKLPTANPNAYDGWCDALSALGYSCGALGITPTSTVFELDIKSAPISSIPISSIPISSIPISSIPISSIPISSIPISSIPISSIKLTDLVLSSPAAAPISSIRIGNTPISSIVLDCANFAALCSSNTTLGAALAAGAVRPGATLGQISPNFAGTNITLAQLAAAMPSTVTLGDFLLMLVRRADLPWESIPLERLNLPAAGPDVAASLVEVTATFDVRADRPAEPLVLSAEIPSGFTSRAVPGSQPNVGGTPLPHTRVVTPPANGGGEIVTFTFPASAFPADARVIVPLRIKAGLVPGKGTTTWKLSPANRNAAEVVATMETPVEEANEPNNDPNNPATFTPLAPDTLMTGAVLTGDDNDFYQVASKGPKGTRNTFYLSNLATDADLLVYDTSGVTSLRSGPLRQVQTAPLTSPVDPSLRTTGNPLDPQPAADLGAPYPLSQVAGYSIKRGAVTETVEVVSNGTPGGYVVQVRPYNNESSAKPYLLRLKQVVPPTANCITAPSGSGGVLGTAPSAAALAGKSSVILVNRHRLGNIYGAATVEGATGVMGRLDALAAQTNGVVVSVDADPAVRNAYAAWDGSPCNVDGANAVVLAINNYVDGLFPAGPARNALRSITIVGSDDQIPMGRVADDTKLSNEAEYASDLASADNRSTPLSAAAVGYTTLTDDAYASFTPRSYGSRILYGPDVAIGRLVETPNEILTQINTFLTPTAGLAVGEIDPQTSLVTGYDFLSDGALALRDNLAPRVPSQATLISETWTRTDLANQVFPAGASPAIQSLNAHFSHNEALPAAGNTTGDTSDLFTTADVAAAANANRLAKRILLSVGCHAGASVPDVYVGNSPRRLDWAQAFARQGSVFIANTGYGYGDTDLVAYSEKLHRELARNLRNGSSIADAIRFAKQAYLADGLTNVYDPKVLMQTVYYGIPQYRIAGTFVPQPPPVTPPLGIDPKTDLQASQVTVNTAPVEVPGPFYVVPGEDPLVADGRPIQPRTDVDVTQPGLIAHGALITSLTSTDRPNFPVKFSRPMVDLAANEQPVKPLDSAYPTVLQNVTSFSAPGANGAAVERQQLVLGMGQWFNTSAVDPGIGTQRIYSNLSAKVFYRPPSDTDFTPPAIAGVVAARQGNDTLFSVTASDPAGIKRVLVLYLDGGTWRSFDLTSSGPNVFSGATPTQTANPNYFVQVVDGSGNVAVSANKAVLFNAPSGGGGNPPPNVEPPVVVTNAAPVVSALTITPTTGPTTTVTIAGSFTDADSTSWTGTVDFGDGSGPTALTLNADKTFSALKTFSTPGTFNYTATVVITDNQGAATSQQGAYTVTVGSPNAAPVVTAAAATTAVTGAVVTITVNGAFTDADSTAWTGTVDWGAGAGVAPLTINNTNRTFTAQTTSFTAGARTGTVRVCDTANACGTRTFTYTVNPPPRQLLTPFIDCITVTSASVTVRLGYNNPNPYPVTIPIGTRNTFLPTPSNRNQPTQFLPGRQQRVFAITLTNVNQVAAWFLDGRIVSFSRNFNRC
jgi:hypothetical protein